MNIELTKKRTHRVRDYILYLAISFAVVGVILFVGLSHVDHEKSIKWLFFLFDTPVVFGFVIEASRASWRRNSFWLVIGSLLLLHCLALAVILTHFQHPKGSWLVGAVPLEIAFILNFTRWLLRPNPSPQ
jgi:hypothetical protein